MADAKVKIAKFRFANQYVLLTYKTHLNKKETKEFFEKLSGYKEIEIAHENGKDDPETPYEHTHIYINFGKRFSSTNARIFDIGELHPHIAPITKKSEIPKVLNYISKEDPECGHLKKKEDIKINITEAIWKCDSKAEALGLCKKPGDAQGILTIFANKPKNDLKDDLKLNEWQGELFQKLTEKPDDRSIIWIVDKKGGIGKSRFCRWMMMNKLGYVITQLGGDYHASATIKSAIESGWDKKVLLIDLSRSYEDKEIYSPIEAIKNGMMTSVKYAGETLCFDPPHVVVFANFLPNVSKLSLDRWQILEISTPGANSAYNIKALKVEDILKEKAIPL